MLNMEFFSSFLKILPLKFENNVYCLKKVVQKCNMQPPPKNFLAINRNLTVCLERKGVLKAVVATHRNTLTNKHTFIP